MGENFGALMRKSLMGMALMAAYHYNRPTLPIELLCKYNCLLLAHKINYHKQLLPNIFSNYFLTNSDIHAHDTRSKNLIHMSQHNTNLGLRHFNYFGGHLWNSLPKDVREIININLFKKTIKLYLQKII